MEPLRGLEALWHFEWRWRLSGRLLGGKHFRNRSEGVHARSGQFSKQSKAQTENKRKWRFWFSRLDPQARLCTGCVMHRFEVCRQVRQWRLMSLNLRKLYKFFLHISWGIFVLANCWLFHFWTCPRHGKMLIVRVTQPTGERETVVRASKCQH